MEDGGAEVGQSCRFGDAEVLIRCRYMEVLRC
jgi:hypothetical protein